MSQFFEIVVIGGGVTGGYFLNHIIKDYGHVVDKIKMTFERHKIALISNEGIVPYERPGVTKATLGHNVNVSNYLVPSWNESKTNDADWYKSNGIHLFLNTDAIKVDDEKKSVHLSDNSHINYNYLIVATGLNARRFSTISDPKYTCADKAAFLKQERAGKLQYIKTIQDVLDLQTRAAEISSIVIYGGGVNSGEVASGLVANFKNLNVIWAYKEDKIMQNVFPPQGVEIFENLTTQANVKLFPNSTLSIVNDNIFLMTKQNDAIPADLFVACIGAEPATEMLPTKLLDSNHKVIVDSFFQTKNQFIFAMGDITAMQYDSEEFQPRDVLGSRLIGKQMADNMAQILEKKCPSVRYQYFSYSFGKAFNIIWIMYGTPIGELHKLFESSESIFLWFANKKLKCALIFSAKGVRFEPLRKRIEDGWELPADYKNKSRDDFEAMLTL